MGLSLIAFDTDQIKGYVFATYTLKEIRGASSLLDRLNRDVMEKLAESHGGEKIYANGGSGLFLIDSEKAVKFGTKVQHEYRKLTAEGASVTYVVQPLPEDAPDTLEEIEKIMMFPMRNTLALLRYRLREQKGHPHAHTDETSHPLMRLCDSCGIFYAVKFVSDEQEFYCQSCLNKQIEDGEVKEYITAKVIRSQKQPGNFESPLWDKILNQLERYNYRLPLGTKRPEDLNVFGEFRKANDYLGLIYADANGMGEKLNRLATLQEVQDFARTIDDAVYWALCEVISDRLPAKELGESWVFPFDILLIGGDDLVLVTPAAQAMAVAYALAKRFYAFANGEQKRDSAKQAETHSFNEELKQDCTEQPEETHSLSVGVVLAPTNYPFSLLLHLVEDTLKFAKKDGSRALAKKESQYGKTRINFLVVSGSTSQSFDKVYDLLRQKKDKGTQNSFYATMRPYTLEQLKFLLAMLQEGSRLALGRSKLHQLREAVLQRNLSTSVTESLAVVRSWKREERDFVVKKVYSTERGYPLYQWDEQNPAAIFPVVTFPWLVDNREKDTKRYSTLLLDFVELYDFVAREDSDGHDEN